MNTKVRYCVNNPEFGVLHLHESEDEDKWLFTLLLEDGEPLEKCKTLKKGTVVVLEVDDEDREDVKTLTVEGG